MPYTAVLINSADLLRYG